MRQLRSSFDLIINTVSAHLPIASYLRPFGVLVNVGLPTAAYEIPPSLLVATISADEVGAAYDRGVAGDVRYRYVIDTTTIPAGQP